MDDLSYRHFLNWLMCSDPWPVPDEMSQPAMISLANIEAELRGFNSWIDAFHGFKVESSSGKIPEEDDESTDT